jgi:hypothetical protein
MHFFFRLFFLLYYFLCSFHCIFFFLFSFSFLISIAFSFLYLFVYVFIIKYSKQTQSDEIMVRKGRVCERSVGLVPPLSLKLFLHTAGATTWHMPGPGLFRIPSAIFGTFIFRMPKIQDLNYGHMKSWLKTGCKFISVFLGPCLGHVQPNKRETPSPRGQG